MCCYIYAYYNCSLSKSKPNRHLAILSALEWDYTRSSAKAFYCGQRAQIGRNGAVCCGLMPGD